MNIFVILNLLLSIFYKDSQLHSSINITSNNCSFYPLIIIPGLAGSSLNAYISSTNNNLPHKCFYWTDKWFKIWVNLFNIMPYFRECFLYSLEIKFDNAKKKFYGNKGVYVKEEDYGGTNGIESLNSVFKSFSQYFYHFIRFFINNSNGYYVKGKSIRAATYDWRMPLTEWNRYYEKLKDLIINTYLINGNQKMYLIGHSLGGNMAHFFLSKYVDQRFKKKYLKGFISLAGSHDGSYNSLKFLIDGNHKSFPVSFHSITKTFGGALMMLPQVSSDILRHDEICVYTGTFNYTCGNILKFFMDYVSNDTADAFHYIKSFLYNNDYIFQPPKIKTFIIRGRDFPTPKSFYMDINGKLQVYEYFDDGDGTLFNYDYIYSEWRKKQKEDIEIFDFYGEEYKNSNYHRFIVKDIEVLRKVYEIVISN